MFHFWRNGGTFFFVPFYFGEAVRRACDFLSGKATHDTILHISHCMEELLLNYAEHSGKSQKAYMDISILCDRDAITLIVKDDGIPFDPIHAANEEMKAGLKVVQAFMSDASYSYSLGQNIVIMKWGQ